MSNAKRPNLARKVTPASEKHRKAALDAGFRMTIGAEVYEVRTGDITPRIARELRRESGHSWQGLQRAMATDPDVDLVAAFVWLARRLRGEQLDLDDVEIGYADILGEFDVTPAGISAELVNDSRPEA